VCSLTYEECLSDHSTQHPSISTAKEATSMGCHTMALKVCASLTPVGMKGNEIRWPQYSGEGGENTVT
jgi:hypothetical protein